MAMLDENVVAIAKELENVVEKLKGIGLNGSIHVDDGKIEVLIHGELPKGNYNYRNPHVETINEILKSVNYGNVVFETWISKAEAKKELLG